MTIIKEDTIGRVVAADIRTAAVFEKFGLDYCCKGDRTIDAACLEAGIESTTVIAAIARIAEVPTSETNYDTWPIDLLADYIEKRHHRYVNEQIPVLQGYLEKISQVHGDKHPELFEIKRLFSECASELTAHMKKEELMLFPFIRKMVIAKQPGSTPFAAPFGTVQQPVRNMMHEHNVEGERIHLYFT